jgi:hypothetical protein
MGPFRVGYAMRIAYSFAHVTVQRYIVSLLQRYERLCKIDHFLANGMHKEAWLMTRHHRRRNSGELLPKARGQCLQLHVKARRLDSSPTGSPTRGEVAVGLGLTNCTGRRGIRNRHRTILVTLGRHGPRFRPWYGSGPVSGRGTSQRVVDQMLIDMDVLVSPTTPSPKTLKPFVCLSVCIC